MNASDMGKKGAKKRWRGKTKQQRSKEMSRVAKLRWGARKPRRAARSANDKVSDPATR
jgi:hypothetical protein